MKSDQTAETLVRRLETLGFRLSIRGEKLRIEPPLKSEPLLEEVTAHRDSLFHLVKLRGGFRAVPDSLAELRPFCPALWQCARLEDGRSCLVWGVTARGVIVLPEGAIGLITVDPNEVTMG